MGKGQDFERDTCKKLSLWYSNGEREDYFWRTAGSGARATSRFKKAKSTENSAGDVGYLDISGKPFIDYFMLELKRGFTKKRRKNYEKIKAAIAINDSENKALKRAVKENNSKGIDVLDFIDSNGSVLLDEWWNKAEKECIQAGRKEVLFIFKRDGKKPCVMMHQLFFATLCAVFDEGTELIMIHNKYVIISLDRFLEWVTADILKEMIRPKLKLKRPI